VVEWFNLTVIKAALSLPLSYMAHVKCGLYEINKNNTASATHGPSSVQNMFRDRIEATLEQRGPGPGLGPVLTVGYTVTPTDLHNLQSKLYLLHKTKVEDVPRILPWVILKEPQRAGQL